MDGHHLTGADARPQARVTETTVVLADGSELRVSFDWRGEEPFRQQAKLPGHAAPVWVKRRPFPFAPDPHLRVANLGGAGRMNRPHFTCVCPVRDEAPSP